MFPPPTDYSPDRPSDESSRPQESANSSQPASGRDKDICCTRLPKRRQSDPNNSDYDDDSGDDTDFKKLPFEIRSMIWQATYQPSRYPSCTTHLPRVSRTTPFSLPPATVQFDNGIEETWEEETLSRQSLPRLTQGVYVNFATDTFVFTGHTFQAYHRIDSTLRAMGNWQKIRSIAIRTGDPTSLYWIDRGMLRTISRLENLEAIYILQGNLHATYDASRDYEVEVYDPSQRHQQPFLVGSLDGLDSSRDRRNIMDWSVYRTRLETYIVEMWASLWEEEAQPRPMPVKGILTYDSLTQPHFIEEDTFWLGDVTTLHWIRS